MNPIPHPGIIDPAAAVAFEGYLRLAMLLAIVALLVGYAVLVGAVRNAFRRREWLFCPVRLRKARVDFQLAGDGTATDVLRCSIFGRRPVTCGKACMPAAARA
jgi:hypothetical protein